jgi:hypothetical protein
MANRTRRRPGIQLFAVQQTVWARSIVVKGEEKNANPNGVGRSGRVSSTVATPNGLAHADLSGTFSRYVGYTIVATKTIVGYTDKNGDKKQQFDGCNFDRTIIFDDGTGLTCSSYGYQYAYRPTAVILMKSMQVNGRNFGQIIMIVESDSYDMQGGLLN